MRPNLYQVAAVQTSASDDLVTISEAAFSLGMPAAKLRRWCREDGCPFEGSGRGRYRVSVAAVQAWRDARSPGRQTQLRELHTLALDFWRRGRELGAEGHRVLDVSDAKAAALLYFLLSYVAIRMQVAELRTPETELLDAIARQGNVHAMNDSIE